MVGLASLLPTTSLSPLLAGSGERTLYLYYTHTGETRRITFRRNGKYVQSGLNELNKFLRDWRRNEPTRMDPALFDLIWSVYQEVGATEPIYIVSAYRSPQTNEMLRARSSAVAKNSRHTKGMAMDFYIPGIALSKLRETAMRHQVGGVGYYPRSNHPFVHLDTGNVRAWPRMTRKQLARLFPDGKTLHLPSDGVPLSDSGRRYAMAEWNKCHSVPCNGSVANTAPSRSGQSAPGNGGPNLLDIFFGNSRNAGDQVSATVVASARQNTPAPSAPLVAPLPAPRAAFLDYRDPEAQAPIPAALPSNILLANRNAAPAQPDPAGNTDNITVASVGDATQRPTPRTLLSPNPANTSAVSAYVPVINPEPDAQRALEMLIERRSSAVPPAQPAPPAILRGSITTASLGPVPALPSPDLSPGATIGSDSEAISDLLSASFSAVEEIQPADGVRNARRAVELLSSPTPNIAQRPVQFHAPDITRLDSLLVMSTSVARADIPVMAPPDASDFDPATQLGASSTRVRFHRDEASALTTDHFSRIAPPVLTGI